MIGTFTNNFSWSLQRFTMFERCKKEYFYHYYGSWAGWDGNAAERTKFIYRLKNIKSEAPWLKSIIKKTLSSAIKRETEFSLVSCRSFSIRTTYKDIFELERQEFLDDPKKLCLDSIYFAEESISNLKKRITARLECFWNVIWENSFFNILKEKRYGDFISINGHGEFVLNNIKVWVNPGIAYTEKDKKFIIDIYPMPPKNEVNPPFSMSLAILFLKKTYKLLNEEYTPRTIIADKDKCIVLEECPPESEISKLIRESSLNMLSCLTFDKKAYEENFYKTSEKEKCRTCRFREICAA